MKTEGQHLAPEAAQKAEEELFSALPFSARISQSSKEAAALATVSSTEAALEEAFAQVEKDDGAPSAVEAATSEAASMGDLVQQMADTLDTDEAEAGRKANEGRLAGEAAEEGTNEP